jgi:hypothetical protein
MEVNDEIRTGFSFYLIIEALVSLFEMIPLTEQIGLSLELATVIRFLGDLIQRMAFPSEFTVAIMIVAVILKI